MKNYKKLSLDQLLKLDYDIVTEKEADDLMENSNVYEWEIYPDYEVPEYWDIMELIVGNNDIKDPETFKVWVTIENDGVKNFSKLTLEEVKDLKGKSISREAMKDLNCNPNVLRIEYDYGYDSNGEIAFPVVYTEKEYDFPEDVLEEDEKWFLIYMMNI